MVHQGAAAGQSPTTTGAWSPATWSPLQAATPPRKRKAETQDNERLSKRLSLLNLEQNGSKLYVPVESPTLALGDSSTATRQQPPPPPPPPYCSDDLDDTMQLDDSKHKVYIYNIDDELASSSSSDGDADDGRLVFLPDIEQHLRENRIPPHVLANSDGELAGMQMVLYSDPRSLTVPEERDGVHRAILDARRRVREKQRQEREGIAFPETRLVNQTPATQAVDAHGAALDDDGDAMDVD
ncbi:hypothetical protein HRG_006598 [Hirsutella rhossiliensis]|uniref:Uncharacterized protein n=1 Tax=Hirsutella rhossiliensis TaxID=111463 RepID=A0A9P8SIY4_9HYPO|nr:uncharacterized protein HRG_06598 [Hirsutella rhossiliensis]KAH0962496.1 hypothetical protein HRG_06598 [Hirsutella rhossiliensis]